MYSIFETYYFLPIFLGWYLGWQYSYSRWGSESSGRDRIMRSPERLRTGTCGNQSGCCWSVKNEYCRLCCDWVLPRRLMRLLILEHLGIARVLSQNSSVCVSNVAWLKGIEGKTLWVQHRAEWLWFEEAPFAFWWWWRSCQYLQLNCSSAQGQHVPRAESEAVPPGHSGAYK